MPERSIAAAIEACRRRLATSSDSPGLDARLLASHAFGMDTSALVAYGENLVAESRLRALSAMTARREAGEPIAYIIGHKEFCGLRLTVDRRALVPRPETEELVERAVADWHGKRAALLDLGTGCGAIACALADALPDARIVATDVSAPALELAKQNASDLGFIERIELAEGDLFEAFGAGAARFDAIVANLPYVGTDDGQSLEDRVRDHEPALALVAGKDGLGVYRRMLERAGDYLKEDGALYMECGPANARALEALAAKAFPRARTAIEKDLSGRDRVVIVRLSEELT